MGEIEFADEVRLCPLCQLAAVRTPDLDTTGQLAFQCANLHPVFFEALPVQQEAAAVHHVVVGDAAVAEKVGPPAEGQAEFDPDAADEAQDASDAEDAEDTRALHKAAPKRSKR
jgi:hypothetical protein